MRDHSSDPLADEEDNRCIVEAIERCLNIRYLADLGALLAAVEEMRNSGQTRFGSSLHEVYERLIPWPVYADSKEEIKETLDAYRQ